MKYELITRLRSAPSVGLHFLLGSLILGALPRLLPDPLSNEHARTAAFVAAAVTLSIYGAQIAIRRAWRWTGLGLYIAAFSAAGFATISPQERTVLTIPALGLIGASGVFAWSTCRPPSIIERAAFWVQPRAPNFIRPYCRFTTGIWAFLFLGGGLASLVATWLGTPTTGRHVLYWVPPVIGAWAAVEFILRKWWFSHYEDNWIDHAFARVFPWQRTERGQRSHAYLESVRDTSGVNARNDIHGSRQ